MWYVLQCYIVLNSLQLSNVSRMSGEEVPRSSKTRGVVLI